MSADYKEVVKNFKPEFANDAHIQAAKLIDRISKESTPDNPMDFQKQHVIYLLTKTKWK